MEKSRYYADTGFLDDTTQDGSANYARSLVSVVGAHHLVEDELAVDVNTI